MTNSGVISLIAGVTACLTTMVAQAGPIDAGGHTKSERIEMVHEAGHSVDHAWEIYHSGALGGTIASPALQAKIEQHLHQARNLVRQAHEAADRADMRKVQRLVGEIKIHTVQAIQGSEEHKK